MSKANQAHKIKFSISETAYTRTSTLKARRLPI
jgi:hypothetical protein